MPSLTAMHPSDTLMQHSFSSSQHVFSAHQHRALLNGEILIETYPHSAWGGAVTAQMYIPSLRSHVWTELTNYSQWVKFFPDLTHSEVLSSIPGKGLAKKSGKRLYQVAKKAFFMFSAQVEIYLKAIEITHQKIQFRMERGTFRDFSADLALQDYDGGTLLTYSVKATPTIPVPSALIQEAIKFDLPSNLKQMRRVICGS
ncbi:MAG: SRPBCC family protein [Cyanobacteria bacterium P01_F01_bin.150]